jgi:hypothetical protein
MVDPRITLSVVAQLVGWYSTAAGYVQGEISAAGTDSIVVLEPSFLIFIS